MSTHLKFSLILLFTTISASGFGQCFGSGCGGGQRSHGSGFQGGSTPTSSSQSSGETRNYYVPNTDGTPNTNMLSAEEKPQFEASHFTGPEAKEEGGEEKPEGEAKADAKKEGEEAEGDETGGGHFGSTPSVTAYSGPDLAIRGADGKFVDFHRVDSEGNVLVKQAGSPGYRQLDATNPVEKESVTQIMKMMEGIPKMKETPQFAQISKNYKPKFEEIPALPDRSIASVPAYNAPPIPGLSPTLAAGGAPLNQTSILDGGSSVTLTPELKQSIEQTVLDLNAPKFPKLTIDPPKLDSQAIEILSNTFAGIEPSASIPEFSLLDPSSIPRAPASQSSIYGQISTPILLQPIQPSIGNWESFLSIYQSNWNQLSR